MFWCSEKIVPQVFKPALQKQLSARIRHDLPDVFPFDSGIAMNSAVFAAGLFILERTHDPPLYCIKKQIRAIRA